MRLLKLENDRQIKIISLQNAHFNFIGLQICDNFIYIKVKLIYKVVTNFVELLTHNKKYTIIKLKKYFTFFILR